MRKPSDVFERDWEWSQLTNFTAATRPTATLGVVSGHLGQGKTFLLEALTEMTGGFMFAATKKLPRAEALRQLAQSIADFRGQPAPPHYEDWSQAITDLLSLAAERPVPSCSTNFPTWCSTHRSCHLSYKTRCRPR